MKKLVLWVSLLLLCTLTMSASPVGSAAETRQDSAVPIVFEGKPLSFSVVPQNVNNHLMVPIRDLSEVLGIQIDWNAANQSVTGTNTSTSVIWILDQSEAIKSSKSIQLEQPPFLDKGHVFVPLRAFCESYDFNVRWDETRQTIYIEKEWTHLPVVGSAEQLKALLEEGAQLSGYLETDRALKSGAPEITKTDTMKNKALAPLTDSKSAAGYSKTNVQVDGVDEGDVLKTDGNYIYQVNQQRIMVTQAVPADKMNVISSLSFPSQSFQPIELYVDDKNLIVIGSTFTNIQNHPTAQNDKKLNSMPLRYNQQTVNAMIYDLKDKANLKLLREVELEGSYVSSRKVGSSLYLVANKSIGYSYIINNQTDEQQLQAPAYRDTVQGDHFTTVPFEMIRYFPQAVAPNYLLIAGVNLDASNQAMQVAAFVGSGRNIYATQKNLYVAVNQVEHATEPKPMDTIEKKKALFVPDTNQTNTRIYKFALDNGKIRSTGSGKVPGTILNQFAMDENDDYFRIATTAGNTWRTDEHTSKNNLYILDESMNITGKIEDMAPGEKIYSVRFMGKRAYMVTFKNVDPLFVLDVQNPRNPKILGSLKIPGYSSYLHPYDENHLIGFGKDTIEASSPNGIIGSSTALYQGLKMALFDVTDVSHPVEMFKETLGDRGTDSELLRNHKALLFSKENQLLAFPVSLAEIKNPSQASNPHQYGQFTFQGLYVYQFNLSTGFQLKGRITHLSEADMAKSGNGWYGSNKNIERGLYIGNVLYSVSNGAIQANDLNSLQEISHLDIF